MSMKMEPTLCSETSAIRTNTPGELPKKEHITVPLVFVCKEGCVIDRYI